MPRRILADIQGAATAEGEAGRPWRPERPQAPAPKRWVYPLSTVRVRRLDERGAHDGRPAQRSAARLCGGSAGHRRRPRASLSRALEAGEDIEGGRWANHGVQPESPPAGAGKAIDPR